VGSKNNPNGPRWLLRYELNKNTDTLTYHNILHCVRYKIKVTKVFFLFSFFFFFFQGCPSCSWRATVLQAPTTIKHTWPANKYLTRHTRNFQIGVFRQAGDKFCRTVALQDQIWTLCNRRTILERRALKNSSCMNVSLMIITYSGLQRLGSISNTDGSLPVAMI